MSLEYHSTKRNRVYKRKFDHEEAKRRYAEGESMNALAEEYGVTHTAVWYVVSERGRAQVQHATRHMKLAGKCDRCGGFMHGTSRYHGSTLCRDCAFDDLATSVGDGELLCFGCKEWKDDEDFSQNRSSRNRRRGRHSYCRACNTKKRQEYRERVKVPCIRCGALCLPPNEKVTSGASFPRCRECFYEDQRRARNLESEEAAP